MDDERMAEEPRKRKIRTTEDAEEKTLRKVRKVSNTEEKSKKTLSADGETPKKVRKVTAAEGETTRKPHRELTEEERAARKLRKAAAAEGEMTRKPHRELTEEEKATRKLRKAATAEGETPRKPHRELTEEEKAARKLRKASTTEDKPAVKKRKTSADGGNNTDKKPKVKTSNNGYSTYVEENDVYETIGKNHSSEQDPEMDYDPEVPVFASNGNSNRTGRNNYSGFVGRTAGEYFAADSYEQGTVESEGRDQIFEDRQYIDPEYRNPEAADYSNTGSTLSQNYEGYRQPVNSYPTEGSRRQSQSYRQPVNSRQVEDSYRSPAGRRPSENSRRIEESRQPESRRPVEDSYQPEGRRPTESRRQSEKDTASRHTANTRRTDPPSVHGGNQMKKKRKKKKGGFGRFLRRTFVTLFVLCILGVIAGAAFFQYKSGESIFQCIKEGHEIAVNSQESDFTHTGKTEIYADDGTTLIAELSEDNESNYLTYDEIPDQVIDAFVAVEDRSFWTNNGVNLKGMVRVLINFIRSKGQTANGASTITQQLVKLTYLSTEKTLERKVKEIVIALEITKKYSKEQIIEYYCNTCCFANGIYGIEDASRAYFNQSVSSLSLSQIAYLCAIPNWPEHYNPRTYPDNALERRDKILKDMLNEGYITQEQYEEAVNETIYVASSAGSDEDDSDAISKFHNYETTYAVNCAVKYIMSASDDFQFQYSFDSDEDYENYRAEYADAYDKAKHALYTGNYKIYTTLDLNIQEEMQEEVDSALSGFTGTDSEGIYLLQGAMTVIDNATGKVVSIVGGRSQSEIDGIYSLNRGYQSFFQPGSSIKPLVVYTPALDSGLYTSSSLLTNVDVDSAKYMSVSEIQQMDGTQVPLRTAVENSLNGCAYWLFSNIGISTGISYLHDMNFSRIVSEDYNVGTCLGGLYYGVSTEEMANAYYTLENDGVYTDTDCLYSIIDRYGNECYSNPESKQVYSKDAANTMTDVLKGVISEGTASGSYWYYYTDTEAAGKTGTTNENKAAWFCGYTPYYSIAVWVGCDTPTSIEGLQGSSYPLTIWENAMLDLIEGLPAASFDEIDEDDSTWVDLDEDIAEDQCICSTKCIGDTLNELCPVCLKDPSLCEGAAPVCSCTTKCTSDSINIFCPLCSGDISGCLGTDTSGGEQSSESGGDSSGGESESESSGDEGGGDSGDGSGDGDGGDIWVPTDDGDGGEPSPANVQEETFYSSGSDQQLTP